MTEFLESLKAIVGPRGWKTDAHDLEPYLTEWRGVMVGRSPMVVAPATTEAVAAGLQRCARGDRGAGW